MKNTLIFLVSLLTLLLFVFLACEKNEQIPVQTDDENTVITNAITNGTYDIVFERAVDSCAQCFPLFGGADCCCGIELLQIQGGGNADIDLCGTWDGTDNCKNTSPGGSCPSTFGGGQSATLDLMSDPKLAFCMENDSVVCITNSGSNAYQIFFTCQYDQSSPQSVSPTIGVGNTLCYSVNSNCQVTLCQ